MFKTKKIKLALFASGFLLTTTVVGSLVLSSCVSSSSTTPYAPYTALYLSSNNSTNYSFRYQTSNNESSYYNTSNYFGSGNQNKYLSKTEIKNYYYSLAKKAVDSSLNSSNWDKIKTLYGATNSSTTVENYKSTSNYKNNQPVFFYGVAPTTDMVNIANIYNQLNVISSVFQYASSLSNELISYLACDGINNLIDSSSQDITELSSNINIAGTNNKNQNALQLIAGQGVSFGVGKSIYQLWPSGFKANITSTNLGNSSNQNANNSNGIMDASKTNVGDINAPYNLANYSSSSSATNKPKSDSYKITVSDISITYQWYKTERVGGNYISNISQVNDSLTSDQQAGLKRLGITDGKVGSIAYNLPIANMEFDVVPEAYSYQDPFYLGFYDTVSTGLYDVKAPMVLTSANDIDYSNTYPEDMKAKIGNSKSINWRGIVTSNKNNLENHLPSSVYAIVKDKNLSTLPYYQSNLSYLNNSELAPYSITDSKAKLSAFNVTQLINIFKDPFNKIGASFYYDQPVYNNVNNLNKQVYLNIWALGWLTKNQSNDKNIADVPEYKQMKKTLNFGTNSSVDQSLISDDTFRTGKEALYSLVNLSSTSASTGYKFNSNGISNLLAIDIKKENEYHD